MSLFRGFLGLGLEPGNQFFLGGALAKRVLVGTGRVMLLVTRDLAALLRGTQCVVIHVAALSVSRPTRGRSDPALAANRGLVQVGTV